jgi:hypothetical protein
MLKDRLNQPADCPNMVLLDAEDVLQLLRSEIERAGGPMAFSKKARVDRATVHRTLKREEGLSRKIIHTLNLRTAYVPKQQKLKPNGRRPTLQLVPPTAGPDRTRPLLLVNGNLVRAQRAHRALLACLYDELGRVVPYERLCRVIGHQSSGERQLHILQQQMMFVRRLLTKHETRYFLAVVTGVGYALCEVAEG